MHVGHGEARRTSHFPDLRAGSDSTMARRTGDDGIKFRRLRLHRGRSPLRLRLTVELVAFQPA